jgi:hypothetical protein
MRYETELDLRLVGDKVECQKYIARARTVLGEVWNRDIVLGELEESWRTVILDQRATVTIYATRFMNPIVTITVTGGEEPPERVEYLVKLAWLPEGILLTPATGYRSDETYVSWGLPSRQYDTGEKLNLELDDEGEPVNEIGLTENGSLPQALLNRFPNNKYLDLVEHISNLPKDAGAYSGLDYPNLELRDSVIASGGNAVISYETATIITQPWSFALPDDEGEYVDGYFTGATFWTEYGLDIQLLAGVHKITIKDQSRSFELLGLQFDEEFNELITENKAADIEVEPDVFEQQWFCHNIEEKLYPDPISEQIFLSSNIERVAVGEEPVYRMIRGDANSAKIGAYVINQSEGHFHHSHEDFLPGYRTTGGRVANAIGQEPFSGYGDNVRENIAAVPAGSIPEELVTPAEIGAYITELWVNSPPHYANIVSSQWTEFGLPFTTWGKDGTFGASHQIGSYGVNTYVDRSRLSDSSITDPIEPPATDATLWAQLFTARETWLPVYDLLHEGAYGATGTFNGWNPYSHSNYVSHSRRVGWNKHVYQLPAGLVEPYVSAAQDPISPFLACVGSAMIIVEGEKWIRAVYFESAMVPEAVLAGDGLYPQEGDDITIKVVKFPIRLMETSIMPFRTEIPATYELEYEFEWTLDDGWLSNPPGAVVFNSTGDKFTFTMHKIGDSRTVQALDYKAEDWTDDRSALPFPRADIQCHHFEWDESILDTLADMTVFVPTPLIASIECWTDHANAPVPETYTNSESTTCYIRTLKGQYEVFPHYDKEDVLSYVILDIDEVSVQKANRVELAAFAGKVSFCYRVRKMIFPSTKEITYMQQYMEDMWTSGFDPTLLPEEPGYKDWPGTGYVDGNFFCVIHYMNELNEDLIYSKIRTEKIVVDYGFPNDWYRVDGDTDYIVELNPEPIEGDPEAEPRVTEIMGVIAYDTTRRALNVYDQDGDGWAMDWSMSNTLSIYHNENSPCTWMITEGDSSSRVPTGYVGANTTGFTIPEIEATTTMSPSPGAIPPGPDEGYYFREAYRGHPQIKMDAPCGREPFENYAATCHTGYGYYGESNTWYLATAKKDLSFMQCNFSPLFGKAAETEAKIVRYDDRIIARVGINHTHKYGLAAPEYFKPAPNIFTWNEWDHVEPPEGQEAFVWSNFDLDEALGIEDVTDVWPMGKIV